MFLLGTGYHVNIFKEDTASVAAVSRVIQEYVNNAEITLLSSNRLRYNVKTSEAPHFPALFAALEHWKHDLGLTGLGIECTTLEDVFLKLVQIHFLQFYVVRFYVFTRHVF